MIFLSCWIVLYNEYIASSSTSNMNVYALYLRDGKQ